MLQVLSTPALKTAEYFANLEKPGKEQRPSATDQTQIIKEKSTDPLPPNAAPNQQNVHIPR
jgi:hypothetical protein